MDTKYKFKKTILYDLSLKLIKQYTDHKSKKNTSLSKYIV